MTETVDHQITTLLSKVRAGEQEAQTELWSLVYSRLRQIAHGKLKLEGRDGVLNTTGLVHETYLKLAQADLGVIENRGHFYAIASRAMRHILVDAARKRCAQKRAPEEGPVDRDVAAQGPARDVIAINDALEALGRKNNRMATVVECRFFGGLTNDQVAEALDVSTKTIEREWQRARAYLELAMRQDPQLRD